MGNAKLQYVQGRPIFTNINEHKCYNIIITI